MRLIVLLTIFCTLIIPYSINAQTEKDENKTRFGIGIGLNFGNTSIVYTDNQLITATPGKIYFSILTEKLKIEPEVGFTRLSGKSEDAMNVTNIISSAIEIGTGVFVKSPINNSWIYYGGRVGILSSSRSVETRTNTGKESITNFWIGPALGAEYFWGDHFSLGGEAQVIYTKFGKPYDNSPDQNSIDTRGIIFFRWYF